jgi:hypothetical protein
MQRKGKSKMNKLARSSKLRLIAKVEDGYVNAADGILQHFGVAIRNPDLQAVLAFSLIGLLVALNLILRFPDFGTVIAQYNQF